MFRNLVLSAAAAGLAAGLLTAALQHVTTMPIILAAERYEAGAPAVGTDPAAALVAENAAIATHDGVHEHEGWAPADGLERTAYTSLSTIVTGVGFGLVLLAAMALSNQRIDGRAGLAFGIAGFAAVSLAPALGLPPELPGSAAADLAGRQAWWLFTALATAGGLAALFLGRGCALRIAGIAVIALPHIVGAPQPDAFASTAPAELAGHFAAASLAVTAVFWAVLGYLAGSVHERLARAE